MLLSNDNKNALLLSLHKLIEEHANATATAIFQGKQISISYPPNGGLTEAEEQALALLKGNDQVMAALRKLFANNTAEVFFSFFNMLDGTTVPGMETGSWSEVLLVDKPDDFDEDTQFLHDEFYNTYWDWKNRRGGKDWSLDTLG